MRKIATEPLVVQPPAPIPILGIAGEEEVLSTKDQKRNQARVIPSLIQSERQAIQRWFRQFVVQPLYLRVGQAKGLEDTGVCFERQLAAKRMQGVYRGSLR
jgi:hypothetical protein